MPVVPRRMKLKSMEHCFYRSTKSPQICQKGGIDISAIRPLFCTVVRKQCCTVCADAVGALASFDEVILGGKATLDGFADGSEHQDQAEVEVAHQRATQHAAVVVLARHVHHQHVHQSASSQRTRQLGLANVSFLIYRHASKTATDH